MSTTDEFDVDPAQLSEDDFLSDYPFPFLLIRVSSQQAKAGFQTAVRYHDRDLEKERLFPVRKRASANAFSFISVGRARNNDVVIESSTVSKCHAVITEKEGGIYAIADAGSTNGTLLNGEPIGAHKPVDLKDNDVIGFSSQISAVFMEAKSVYSWLLKQKASGSAGMPF